MANIDEHKPPVPGDDEDKKNANESPALPRDAGQKPEVEEREETLDLPAPKRQPDYDAEDDPDERKADSAFDDLNIEVDESELESELHGQPPGRKT